MQGLLAKGNLPNATSLLDAAAGVSGMQATANAAKSSWFTPNAPNWANVESSKIMQNTLIDLVTGKQTVDQAAKAMDDKITQILNQAA
jgi:N,N'-diacetylchitobiose transport system substrate-binding protein